MYVIDVRAGCGRKVKVAPCIRVDTEKLSVQHAVVEEAVLQTACFIARSSRVLEVRELEAVQLRTYSRLNLQLRNDVIHNLSVHTEQVLVRLVAILIDIPIRIHIIRVHTVPILVFTVLVLVVLKPSLIIGRSQCHQVLTNIRLIVT